MFCFVKCNIKCFTVWQKGLHGSQFGTWTLYYSAMLLLLKGHWKHTICSLKTCIYCMALKVPFQMCTPWACLRPLLQDGCCFLSFAQDVAFMSFFKSPDLTPCLERSPPGSCLDMVSRIHSEVLTSISECGYKLSSQKMVGFEFMWWLPPQSWVWFQCMLTEGCFKVSSLLFWHCSAICCCSLWQTNDDLYFRGTQLLWNIPFITHLELLQIKIIKWEMFLNHFFLLLSLLFSH